MKKTILLVVMAMAALSADATDRFYIEDLLILPGETRTVCIVLDNETQYTAFQTDIYLPEGLTVEQEDGDYIFDLTNRKANDHNIASQLQVDGAIRIMSYSPRINAYSGYSGALVTFNVTASADFSVPAVIELKNTLFIDLNAQEITFSNESCQVTMNDFTGEIVFEEGGNRIPAMDWDGGKIDIYDELYISYSGDEDVDYTIVVNDRYLLEDEELNQCISWDETNNCFVVNLYGLIYPFGDQYSANLYFDVTVHATGYNDLSSSHHSFVSYTPGTYGLSISEYGWSDFSYQIEVEYGYSVHFCDIDCEGNYICFNEDDEWGGDDSEIYAVERLDHDYYITVTAAHKTPMSSVFSYIEKTFLIPARECDIAISQNDVIKAYSFWDDFVYTGFETGELESGGSCAIIETNSYIRACSITIDNQLLVEDDWYTPAYAIDLLRFDDIFGGEHHIDVALTDGWNYSLSVDTVLVTHPVVTRLVPDSLILDIDPNMSHVAILVNDEEVELSDNGHHFALERQNHDYSVTVQVGHRIIFEWDEVNYESHYEWSKETTLVIPAKSSFTGDVDGNGLVNIGDVTALIDYLLSGNASSINLDNADCNGNGAVNIGDVADLIDYLLIGHWPEPEPTLVITPFTANGVTFNMVEVEGGTFQMGGTPEQGDNIRDREKPVHQVTLSTYHIGQTEVTQELWQAVMGVNPSYHTGDLQRPVERVSWVDCQEFIYRLNQITGKSFRLPTEAEWENAARGGNKSEGYRYAGGNDMDVVSWYINNSNNTTHPVGTKAPNELGLYDMTGNVWEWNNDWYKLYTADSQVDPTGPATGNNRVLRGGCWNGDSSYNRISYRDNFTPTGNNSSGGLRLVLDDDYSTKLRLNETVVKVESGWKRSVYILNGSGNYTVAGGTNYVTAAIDGNKLTVTGTAIGTTTVCVTDAGTGATAVLAVIVTEATAHEDVFNVNGVTFQMVTVNGGSFIMGATEEMGTEYYSYERPTHMVTLSDYKIGQTEVTQELWQAVMGNNPSNFTGNLQRPVEQVSWNDCQTFITLLNQITGKSFRLPTEAEWEFAARGGNLSQIYTYAGSNNANDVAWLVDNSDSMTHPVGIKAPNELNLYDMSGNVFEWCQDWFGNYSSGAQTNPTGPTDGTYRVCRGGAWNYIAKYCRSSHRSYHSMTSRYNRIGLRLALD